MLTNNYIYIQWHIINVKENSYEEIEELVNKYSQITPIDSPKSKFI